MRTHPVFDIDTGALLPIDPFSDLVRQSSAEEERDVRLAGLLAGIVDRRPVLLRERPATANGTNGARLLADGSTPTLDSVTQPRALDTAVTPEQTDGALGPIVAPPVVVDAIRGSWFSERVSDELHPVLPAVFPLDGHPGEAGPTFAPVSFACVPYALATRIDKTVVGAADFDLLEVAIARLGRAFAMRLEIAVSSLLLASASWAASSVAALGPTAKWNGGSTSDPIADVWARRAASSLPCDALVISEAVEPFLFTSSNRLRDFVQAGGKLPEILVGRMRRGAVGSPSGVWGSTSAANAVLVRRPKSPTDLSTARTFRWNGLGPKARNVNGFFVRVNEVTDFGASGGYYVVASVAEDVVMIDSTVGGLIGGVIQ